MAMMIEMVKIIKMSPKYRDIAADLIKQLKSKNANTPTLLSQIDDYMAMWVTKELLIMDIETRGSYVEYDNGGGQTGTKKNESVADLIKVNAQMLKLLDALEIKPSNSAGGEANADLG